MTKRTLTTASGIPVPDNQNSLTAGPRGPVLLEDFHLIEKLQHFNRERVPERVVHAKGSGAHGSFTVTQDISRYSKAKLFDKIGKQTPIFIRFSTVGGERGYADTDRDPRGFAMKFYTEEGNWDLVGNNTPVFFIKDPSKFPDFIHTQKRDPRTNMRNGAAKWDFWSLSPEALHQITILFSDRGIPDGYRFQHGFGSHTFSLINAQGERFWVKFHAKSMQGIKNLRAEEATRLAGTDPEHAQRDLYEAIERKDYPKWQFNVQVMPEAEADAFAKSTGWNPFDLTKVWPQKDYPLIEVGVLELNRNPENYFAEVEQAAFSPASVVPGIGFSPDRMLQGRIFAYHDAHLYRIGTNYQHLPVNRPQCPYQNYQRDGAMRFDGNSGGMPVYEPNSIASAPKQAPEYREPPQALSGNADRYDHRQVDGDDYYTQPGNLYRLLPDDEKERLTANIAGALAGVPNATIERMMVHFAKADPDYAKRISGKLQR